MKYSNKKPGNNCKIGLTAFWILLLFFIQSTVNAQKTELVNDSLLYGKQIDIIDVLREWVGKKPLKERTVIAQERVKNVSLLPIVGYSPANGFVVGGAISATEYLGNPKTTQLSSALINASFTTKEQILLNLRFDLYLKENKWYITGDNRLLFFAQPTYGLGIYGLQGQPYTFNVGGSEVSKIVQAQDMRFNYVRLYETFSRRIVKKWYAGVGLMFDIDFKIKDEYLKLDTPNAQLSSHYIYSKSYGFDTSHYSANGFAFTLMQDSRDNPVNAYSGTYFNLIFRINPVSLGSTQNSTMLYYEWRNYISLSKKDPRNVLAFWLWGVMVTSGRMPYLALPAITWDTYNRSGRGYIQGRFRGNDMIYEEAEYRFRLSRNGLFGGVAFINLTTASNPLTGQSVFYSVAPGYGFGLRIKMNNNDRTNIAIDYGRGDGFSGVYFNIREAF